MKKLLVANWKMNPHTVEEAKELFEVLANVAVNLNKTDIVVCPPSVYLPILSSNNIFLGAQNAFWHQAGSYTGEISPEILKQFGIKYLLVGHSERRRFPNEDDQMVNKKIKAAIEFDIIPLVFVGEQEQTDARRDFLIDQISQALDGLSREDFSKVILVYEPVWAISSTRNSRPVTVVELVSAVSEIRDIVLKIYPDNECHILYGGSTNAENAKDILSQDGIGGAVIGAASLKALDFLKIVEISESL